ncbi:MAG: hypothetical protein H7Y04_09975 [Verrucomicrobia bacterium]|nr:hypothetical protein [Cytophagales bacterium]
MKYIGLRFLLLTSILTITLNACRPKVDEPDITNCLITKLDNLELNSDASRSGSNDAFIPTSTVFEYDNNDRPVRFSYFKNGKLDSYDQLTYATDGTLLGGVTFNESGNEIGTVVYSYDNNKRISLYEKFNSQDNAGEVRGFTYSSTGSITNAISIQLSDNFNGGFSVEGFAYRYSYDEKGNITNRFSKYLTRSTTTADEAFFIRLISDLNVQREFLNVEFSDYDDRFNPYRSEPNLAAVFDEFPSFNNARKSVWRYVDSGEKYADITYDYQYNRRGFPFLYTVQVKYTAEYIKQYEAEDFIQTSSLEYECK